MGNRTSTRDIVKDFVTELDKAMAAVSATDAKTRPVSVMLAADWLVRAIKGMSRNGGKLIFVGNGGSASIASHMAVDFWKNGGIRAVAFNDASLLTCLGNDYGYEHVFAKPVEMFGTNDDILIAISSSGRSKNILRAVNAARRKKAKVITMSGFSPSNPLRKQGDINFYVPSYAYGTVEAAHLLICHSLVDYFTDI